MAGLLRLLLLPAEKGGVQKGQMVLFNAITVVGKCTRDEHSRVHVPLYCGDTYSPVGNLIKHPS